MRLRRCVACLAIAVASLSACSSERPDAATVHSPRNTALTTPTTRATTTTSAPATGAVYPASSLRITVIARTRDGDAVGVPTTVWYPIARGGERMPLVVFSPGYQIDPSRYDVLTTAWAAAGFVVAEPEYPDTAPGSPPIEDDIVNHPAELRQVITTLLGDSRTAPLIADNEIGLIGQSDGGDVSLATAYNTCCRDGRIAAAIILSGAEWDIFGGDYYTAGGPPILVVQGDEDTVNAPACSEQLFNTAPEPRFYFEIFGGDHLSAYTAPIGPQVAAVRQVTISFLDGYLKGMSAKLTELQNPEGVPGVGRVIDGPTRITVRGSCPGAPGPGGA